MAVFCFYILAGLVSAKLIDQIFKKNIVSYLKDRFLRIYPMAIFWQLVSILALFLCFDNLLNLSLFKFLSHLLLIPLNYVSLLDLSVISNRDLTNNFILPPYFSLGIEVQIYLIFAFLLCYEKKDIMGILALFSFLNYCIFSLVKLDSDFWQIQFTYIYIFSIFWIFYIGYLIYIKDIKKIAQYYLFICFLIVIELLTDSFYGVQPYCSIALLVFIPIVYFLQNRAGQKLKFNNFFGSMSFIIYCNHYLFILILQENKIGYDFWTIFFMAFLSGLTTYFLIEKPLNKFRKTKKI
ncbi:hypothetical protein OFN99_09040 [Campylobacter sp. JMF_03 NE3]|nr:acyltransferase family protein [Campylobacter sp. JMF_03 NE3]MDA3053593.1 hypothetical protein [Campylobacter sp. JMF_03 NE3]